jgi:hypothetical protein
MPYTNIHAYTAVTREDYPAFVSINRDDRSGEISVTVRSRGDGGRSVGMIVLTPEQLRKMAMDVLDVIGPAARLLPGSPWPFPDTRTGTDA